MRQSSDGGEKFSGEQASPAAGFDLSEKLCTASNGFRTPGRARERPAGSAPQRSGQQVIAVNLTHPREIFTTAAGVAEAWQLACHRGTDVFFSQDLPGYFRSTQHLAPRAGPGNHFVRIAERRYLGLSTVIVAEYRYGG